MKKILILLVFLTTFKANSQKNYQVGLDFTQGLPSILKGANGFAGSMILKETNEKSVHFELDLGGGILEHEGKVQTVLGSSTVKQKISGVFVGTAFTYEKFAGIRLMFSNQSTITVFEGVDTDFGTNLNKKLSEVDDPRFGAQFFVQYPFKLGKKVEIAPRGLIAIYNKQRENTPPPFMNLGISQLGGSRLGIGFQIPVFYKF